MEIFLIVLASVLLAVVLVLLLRPRKMEMPDLEDSITELRLKLDALDSKAAVSVRDISAIHDVLEKLPKDVLESITGSLSKRTGKLNELMATFELTKYDRLFYLGEPIDFVGIKYNETVDFIEVKTGKFRLTDDERKLKELIDFKKVNYVPLSVEKVGIGEGVDTEQLEFPSPQ